MRSVLVTGADGFIGRNLVVRLLQRRDLTVFQYDKASPERTLEEGVAGADLIFHLAGVNRPIDAAEFETGNHGFTLALLHRLRAAGRTPVIVATSSTQATLDNPYGVSKRNAEQELVRFREEMGAPVWVYRFTNVFGKWSRPFYNSVVATFCYQAAHGQLLHVDDPARVMEFMYIDDVVGSFLRVVDGAEPEMTGEWATVRPTFSILLRDLAAKIVRLAEIRTTCVMPDFGSLFDKYLYTTFLSYLEKDALSYQAVKKEDQRGYLIELFKSHHTGQIFVSRTLPGVVRGNHYHHTKVEKFCVVDGQARIAFRHIVTQEHVEYIVDGAEGKIVDIPPGWTHSITNIGQGDLITIFWAHEMFDPEHPDTYASEVHA